MQPLTLTLTPVGSTTTYVLPAKTVTTATVTAEITPGMLPAREYEVQIELANQPGAAVSNAKSFALFDPSTACFYDFFESGVSKWDLNGDWNIAILSSGERALSDSPAAYKNAGDYGSGLISHTTTITTSEEFSLLDCANPHLTFRHDYVIAELNGSQDVGRVEISEDNGATWETLTAYSGGGIYGLDIEVTEWDNVNWQAVNVDLSAYTGTVRLRLSLQVDASASDKGWILDNLLVQSGPAQIVDLSVTKQASLETPAAGQAISYTITVENKGTVSATNSIVSDTLPTGLTFAGPVTLEGSSGSVITDGAGLPTLATGLTISPGERITVTLPVTVDISQSAGDADHE